METTDEPFNKTNFQVSEAIANGNLTELCEDDLTSAVGYVATQISEFTDLNQVRSEHFPNTPLELLANTLHSHSAILGFVPQMRSKGRILIGRKSFIIRTLHMALRYSSISDPPSFEEFLTHACRALSRLPDATEVYKGTVEVLHSFGKDSVEKLK